MAVGGNLKHGKNMPWLTMAATLLDSNIRIISWPFKCPLPTEILNGSKGVEGLTLQQQAVLKESFDDPVEPITFQRIDNPRDIERKSHFS